jgi:hypothetical protein
MALDVSPSEIEWTLKNLEHDVYITCASRSVLRRLAQMEGPFSGLLHPTLIPRLQDYTYITRADRLALSQFLLHAREILITRLKDPSSIDDPLERRRATFLLIGGQDLTTPVRQFLLSHGIRRIKPDPKRYCLVLSGIYDLTTFRAEVIDSCKSIIGIDPDIFLDIIQYTRDPGWPSFALD